MPPRVAKHDHRYYPISWDEDGQPALWACNGPMACIKTLTRKHYDKLKRKAAKEGSEIDGPARS